MKNIWKKGIHKLSNRFIAQNEEVPALLDFS